MSEHSDQRAGRDDEPTRREAVDTSSVDLYGPRSGSKPALTGPELTRLLKSNPTLARALKIPI
jgi:hypothetical protein